MALQPSFCELEYVTDTYVTSRERFLDKMDLLVPWDEWIVLIASYYYDNKRGRKSRDLELMLRMHLVSCWFNLSDKATKDAAHDSFAIRKF